MKIIHQPIIITMLIIAVSIYFARYINIILPKWIYFYANDFLCMPIILALSLFFIRLITKNNTLLVPLSVVIVVTVYYAFHFEWVLPKYHPRYTSDPLDVVMYIFGAFVFYAFQKRIF